MIWALHGFLGSARDWNRIEAPLRERSGIGLRAIELLDRPIAEETPAEWAAKFVRAVDRLDPEPMLMGYSMGGRLALHALLAAPSLFRKAIIVSAGLGIEGEVERQMRRVRDDAWAHRFETDPWDELLGDWNAQPLFGGAAFPEPRLESELDRSALATALRWWSPAVQKPLEPRLGEIDVPLLWVAGERDPAYVAAATRAVRALPKGELWIAPGAGHRVPWDAPEAFVERAGRFLAPL